ncbi:MAG: DUF2207 domain-containing protein, partial [Firmicutes bacterium]|nr:DUF2207 domain-containing protein [Bacillota bacterium]
MILAVVLVIVSGATDVSCAYSTFTTPEYSVTIDVHEDNTLSVREEILIDTYAPIHGIYRYIPLRGTAYLEENGEVIEMNRAMSIKNIDVEEYIYDVSNESGNKVVKIGNSNVTVHGKLKYVITYDCTLYEDELDYQDIFYYNVIPQGWDTAIERAEVTVNMPKSFDKEGIYAYVGPYGYADEERATVTVEGNTINITSDYLSAYEGITLQIDLEEGYFTGVASTNWMTYVMYGIMAFAVVLAALLWFIYGRDPLVIETVEFYPPDDVTPAEAGFVLDGIADKEDIVSMIIWFADKGYLAIEEKIVEKKGLSGKLLGKEESVFYLHKKRNYYGNKFFARTIFDGLFSTGNDVAISDIAEDFWDYYNVS